MWKRAFKKLYLAHSWIICPKLILALAWLMHSCTLQQMCSQPVPKLSIFDICDNLSYRKIISILVEKPLKISYIKTWTQPTFIYSRSRIETVEQCLKYVQSYICKFYFDKTKLFDRCLPTTKNTYVPG